MADKVTSWILRLNDMVSGPMTRITSTTGTATMKVKQLTDMYDRLGKVSSGVSGLVGNAPGVRNTSGLIEGLNNRIEKLNRLRAVAPSERWLTKLNDNLAKSQKEVQRLNSLTSNVPVQRVTGKIEQLNIRLERLRTKQLQAFDTKHISAYNRMIEKTQRDIDHLNRLGTSESGKTGGFGMAGMLGTFGPAAGVAALAAAAVSGVKTVAQTTAKYEQIGVGFEVLLGSKTKADKMVIELINYANKSPLRSEDVFQSTQTLLGFGVAQQKILPTIKMLGDVSMGQAEKFQSLSLAYSQTQAAGKLMGQDLLQYISAGFNPLQEISKMTGRSMATLRKEMEAGAISARMVEKAFIAATSSGGRFYDMANKQSQTLGGRWSTLMDTADMLALAVGERLKPAFGSVLNDVSSLVSGLTDYIKVPTSQKIQDEINNLAVLQGVLMSSNTKENERQNILLKLKELNPEITKGVNLESLSYESLSKNINAVIQNLYKKMVIENLGDEGKKNLEIIMKSTADMGKLTGEAFADIWQNVDRNIINRPDLNVIQKIEIARSLEKQRIGTNTALTTEAIGNKPIHRDVNRARYERLGNIIDKLNENQKAIDITSAFNKKVQEKIDALNKAFNTNQTSTDTGGADKGNKKTTSVSEDLNKTTRNTKLTDDIITTSTRGAVSGSGDGGRVITMNLTVNQHATINGNNENDIKKLKNDLVSLIVDAAGDAAVRL